MRDSTQEYGFDRSQCPVATIHGFECPGSTAVPNLGVLAATDNVKEQGGAVRQRAGKEG